ncbi:TPA: hypothetical protein EYP70_05515 [Candidatus Bathyarchaeota archaeon]|nr:hypothetical protein [Candidatus Bathyarchaeota archaeon]
MELLRGNREILIVCPKCGHRVPRTPVCIHCGFNLSDAAVNFADEDRGEISKFSSPLNKNVNSKTQIEELINHIIWRAKIVWLFGEGKVSKEIFEKIYGDYTSKINSILASKNDLTNLIEGISIISKLKDAKRRLDELMVRHKIGEIPDNEYIMKYTDLMSELNVLEREAVKFEFQYGHLKKVVNRFFGENYDKIKNQLEKYFRNLPKIIRGQGLVGTEIAETIKEDLNLIMQFLEYPSQESDIDSFHIQTEETNAFPRLSEDVFDEDLIFEKVTSVVKGHDDEIRRIIRAIKMRDNVLIIGRHAEGKTELLLQLHKCLGGIYFHCHEEVSERELIAGFNPSAFVGINPVHMGCLMQIVSGEVKGLPIAFIDEIMKLRPRTQIILFEAMNNKRFINPIDGKTYYLPPEFSVVSSSNLESVVQETPDIAFLDRFGKIIIWKETPDDAIRKILSPYKIPREVIDLMLWVRHQVSGMRYLVPVSIRNIQKFAQEYSYYRKIYRNPKELMKLVVDRLLKIRVLNVFGLREFEEAKNKIRQYIEERLSGAI